MARIHLRDPILLQTSTRGGGWYHENRGSRKILAGSRNLRSVFDKSRSPVFAWFVFSFFESRNFLPKSLGLGFLTRSSASQRVSDFTIRHPFRHSLFPSLLTKMKCLIRPVQVQLTMDPGYSISTDRPY